MFNPSKCAVFSCVGLGDGLITLVLSNNLKKEGHQVDTFHPFMSQMQSLFPGLPLLPRKEPVLENYDHLFIVYEKLDWMQQIIKVALEHYPEKTTVLNPIATPNRDYPFWEGGKFDGTIPFVENLVHFCKEELKIAHPTKENGLQLPPAVIKGKYPKRVIIHPTSSRPGKNWTPSKFIALSKKLERDGFEPVFILTKEEKKEWPEVVAPEFPNLVELTFFIAESGFMIGNDSGIGHLASSVGLPTVTICRSPMTADFWKPSWTEGKVIVPPTWIPNLKGLRLRDKKWQHFVSVRKVYKTFSDIYSDTLQESQQENGRESLVGSSPKDSG